MNARAVHLDRAEITIEHDRVMTTVDFPVTAMLSVIGSVEDGATCELAGVGSEGFVEIDAAFRTNVAKRSAICLFEGEVVRMPLDDFQRGLAVDAEFARRVYAAVRARVYVTEQLQLCNVRHPVERRLARWFALARVRSARDEFPVTHEFLASILGVRRAGVSEATTALEARGALGHRRGTIAVADAHALEQAACECFTACRNAIEESFA